MAAMTLRQLVCVPWILFGMVWAAAALFANKTIEREAAWQRAAYAVPLSLGAVLMFTELGQRAWPALARRLWPTSIALQAAGLALAYLGVGFAIWARASLGRMWSGRITLKENHVLVQRGPYALARHPIYTGICAAFIGTAVSLGTVRALLAVPLFAAAFIYKLNREERLMARTFGEAHAQYRARVKRLVPFIW